MLDAFTTLLSDSYAAAVPLLRESEGAFGNDRSATEQMRWMWLATIAAVQLWDDAGWQTLSERHVRVPHDGLPSTIKLLITGRVPLARVFIASREPITGGGAPSSFETRLRKLCLRKRSSG